MRVSVAGAVVVLALGVGARRWRARLRCRRRCVGVGVGVAVARGMVVLAFGILALGSPILVRVAQGSGRGTCMTVRITVRVAVFLPVLVSAAICH